jgi:TM2 domain-containing membrane protein YozV
MDALGRALYGEARNFITAFLSFSGPLVDSGKDEKALGLRQIGSIVGQKSGGTGLCGKCRTIEPLVGTTQKSHTSHKNIYLSRQMREPMNTYRQDVSPQDTHSKVIGYLLWIFGFTGAHRFYYGKPVTGTIWFFTFGLLGIGWLIDLFLIPAMDREADLRFTAGPIEYNVAWILLTFLGVFGLHRMYQGKWISGLLYLVTGGLFFLGVLYDFWTLNDQVSVRNAQKRGAFQ